MITLSKRIVGLLVVFAMICAGSAAWAEKSEDFVDINTAGVEQLTTLKGIGPALAQRIVDYRDANGRFAHVDALMNVSGIGPKILEDLRHMLTASK